MRLIDADKINPRDVFAGASMFAVDVRNAVGELIKNQPTVDAVEVVRCRECKWADPCICVVCEEGKTVVCGRLHMHVNKDGFCSYGEREEENK